MLSDKQIMALKVLSYEGPSTPRSLNLNGAEINELGRLGFVAQRGSTAFGHPNWYVTPAGMQAAGLISKFEGTKTIERSER